jgi:hypothetical protein
MAMTEQGWNAVITIVQESYTTSEQALAEHLATAVHAFGVPVPVLERVQQAATVAVGRAFQHDDIRSICLSVSMRALQPLAARAPASWGFFIVERAAAEGERQHIEVFLYPEAR